LATGPAQQTDAQSAFEVVSVKPSDPARPGLPLRIGPDSLTTHGALKHLIMLAYDVEDYQVTGGPPWTQSDFYDVRAKAASISTPRQIKSMLQALLADRFRLRLNRETRTMAGYVMRVDRGGPKLPPSKTGMPPDSAGVVQMGGGEIWARGATMKNLARGLRHELERPVLDQTNIEGHYDLKLRFEEGNRELVEQVESDSQAAIPGTAGSIFGALHEVGLRLDSRKIPIEVLVVQNVERPSEN